MKLALVLLVVSSQKLSVIEHSFPVSARLSLGLPACNMCILILNQNHSAMGIYKAALNQFRLLASVAQYSFWQWLSKVLDSLLQHVGTEIHFQGLKLGPSACKEGALSCSPFPPWI